MTAIAFDPNAVKRPDFSIAEVLIGLMGWCKKTYVYPSQRKLLFLVEQFTGRAMSRRTLNRHLRALERDGHLRRVRRLAERPADVLHIRTTLYFPGGRWLARCQRIARGFAGWQRAVTQRDASRRVPHSAHNQQLPTAMVLVATVDKPPAPPE